MSNLGQVVLDIVGAVVGYVIGGPTGALYGFAIASGAGQFLFPTQLAPVTGPRINDHQTTTSALGDPVIIGYGTFMSSGTVNFLAEFVEHATTTTQGGKGAPTQSSTSYSYTQSIGIGLCETTSMNGVNTPIIGIQRVWENGELVYDTRVQQVGESDTDYAKRAAYSLKYAGTFVLYLGTEDQLPDPTIELQQGANTPFYRGLAYIVYPDRALRTDQGLRHPTFKFEILKSVAATPEVIHPTFLSGANNADLYVDILASDTTYGRYYIFNGTSGHQAVLGFNLFNNTQFAENDTLPSFAPLGGVGLAISPDGFVLVTWFTTISTVVIARLDPLTLASVNIASYDVNGSDWKNYATATVNFGIGPVYILAGVGVLGHVNLTDCVTLQNFGTYVFPDHPSVAAGPNESGSAVFWVISNAPSVSGPTGGDVSVNKIVIANGSVSNTTTHTFAPAEFDPLWTYVQGIGDLLVDPNDGHVMFRVSGNGSGATNTHYVLKCNGNTGVIDWITQVSEGANYNYATAQNVISNDIWWLADNPPGLSGYLRINVVTGDITAVSLSSMAAGSQAGAQLTASGLSGGAILAPLLGGPPGSSPGWSLILPNASTPGKVRIADIVADLCERSNLTSHDTSSLGDETVDGYMIATTPMMARDAIVPLRSVGFFDSCETGDTMRFVKRGGAPAMTLVTTDIGAYETGTSDDPAAANAAATQMESDLPQQIRLSYTSPSRDYQPGQQLSLPRFDTMAEQLTDVQLGGVCLDDDQAAQVAEILWNDSWASDNTYTYAVDQSKAALEPTDVVLVPMVDTLMRVRIVGIDDASQILRTITAVSDDGGNYVSSAIAAPVPYTVTMRFYADSALVLIDAPLLLDSNDTGRTSAPLYSVVYPTNADNWTGATVLESDNGGTSFTNVATATNAPATGLATTALADVDSPFVTDATNSVTIKMVPGSPLPSSVTTAQLLNGANGAALINADGTVEIFQFRDVAVVSSDTVTLSYLFRGRRGSDQMTGSHAIGNRFVMLTVPGTVQKTNLALTDLNSSLQWKAVGSHDTLSSVPTVPFTSVGRSLMPYAPWNVTVGADGGTLVIGGKRRARIGAAQWVDRETDNLPLAEDYEEWQADIYDPTGTTIVRTLTEYALPFAYDSGLVASDFGGVPTEIWMALYQVSAQVGRGFGRKTLYQVGVASSIPVNPSGPSGTSGSVPQGTQPPPTVPPPTGPAPNPGQSYPWLAGANIGGTPRAYDDDDFIRRASFDNVELMGIFSGWEASRTKTMFQVMTLLKAANPNIVSGHYWDAVTVANPSVGNYWNTMNSSNYWLRTSYPSGGIVAASYYSGAVESVGNVIDASYQQYVAHYVIDFTMDGDSGSYAPGPDTANPLVDFIYEDDLFCKTPVTGDWYKTGHSATENAQLDQDFRNGQMGVLNKIKALKPGLKLFGNLSGLSPATANTTGFAGNLSGGTLEGMTGASWSYETWGTFATALAAYDKMMSCLNSDKLGIFISVLNTNGTDAYESTPYKASRFAFCFCLLGDAGFYTANNGYNVNLYKDYWFDEFAVDNTGNCVDYGASDATIRAAMGYLGVRVGSRRLLPNGVYLQERTNGMVCVNPKNNGTQQITLSELGGGANAYKYPAGTQDATTNSGASIAATIAIPARAGLILLKRSVFG